MNLLTILYFILVAPPVEMEKVEKNEQVLISTKIVKPAKKNIDESSTYYHVPTKWVKISEKI